LVASYCEGIVRSRTKGHGVCLFVCLFVCFGVIAKVPSLPILVTLMMEAIRFSETSGLTRATRRNIREDEILQYTIILNS
jgi:hypothetical protein